MGKRDRIRGKAVGTALGVVAVIPVALVSPPAWVLTAIGVVAFVVALTQAKTYWLMYGLYTFALVLLLAAPGGVGFEAEERGFQILAGVALLVLGLAVVHLLATWLSEAGAADANSPRDLTRRTRTTKLCSPGQACCPARRDRFCPVELSHASSVLKDVVHPGPPWRLEVSKPPSP